MVRYLPFAAAVAVVLACCSVLCSGAERLGARECEELGFTGLALCSDCTALAEFVKDQGTHRFGLYPLRSSCDGGMIRDLSRARPRSIVVIRM